jgi:glycosyltransferase involved in cell wall biosynthesis
LSAQGASAVRNTGLDTARGELIGFCDDDDVCLPGTGSRAEAALTPSSGIVYGYHQVLIEASGRLVTFRLPPAPTPGLLSGPLGHRAHGPARAGLDGSVDAPVGE